MKKLITMAVVALAATFGTLSASAEDWWIGGSIGYWHESSNGGINDPDQNSYMVMPSIGYNFNPKWAAHVGLGFEANHFCGGKLTEKGDLVKSNYMFSFNPYLRYTYYRSSNNLVQLYLDGGGGIGLGWSDYKHGDNHTAVTWEVGIKPGVSFNITPKFSISATLGMIGYQGANNAAKDGGHKAKGGILLDSTNLNLGFYYNF